MKIATAAHLVGAELLTCGVTQVVGSLSLVCVAIKAIWNAIHLPFSSEEQNKVYKEKLLQNAVYAVITLACMIPFLVPTLIYKYNHLAKKILFPNEGITHQSFLKNNQYVKILKEYQECFKLLKGEEISLTTCDGRAQEIHWFPAINQKPSLCKSNRTVIIFNGNNGQKEFTMESVRNYISKGFNVVTFTYGGNPGCPQNIPMSEQTITYDALAIVKHLIEIHKVAPQHLLSVGTSLGAVLALTVGKHIKSSHVLIQMPFSTPSPVIDNLFDNAIDTQLPMLLKLFKYLGFQCILPENVPFNHKVTILDQELELVTDGLNNLQKVKHISGKFFAIVAEEDGLMMCSNAIAQVKNRSLRDKKCKPYSIHGNLGQDIVDSYRDSHSNMGNAELIFSIPGDHDSDINIHSISELNKFLNDIPGKPSLAFDILFGDVDFGPENINRDSVVDDSDGYDSESNDEEVDLLTMLQT
jgi:hypothetical protein